MCYMAQAAIFQTFPTGPLGPLLALRRFLLTPVGCTWTMATNDIRFASVPFTRTLASFIGSTLTNTHTILNKLRCLENDVSNKFRHLENDYRLVRRQLARFSKKLARVHSLGRSQVHVHVKVSLLKHHRGLKVLRKVSMMRRRPNTDN